MSQPSWSNIFHTLNSTVSRVLMRIQVFLRLCGNREHRMGKLKRKEKSVSRIHSM